MIWKLLRKNISPAQIIGYALASLVGLTIVICAIQFHADVDRALRGDSDAASVAQRDFLVISKPVSIFNTLGRRSTEFTDNEIADLEAQPWVTSVGEFAAANFSVSGYVEFEGHSMSTYLFLEAVDDNFLDISPEGWEFDPEDADSHPTVPIIIARDYLALYNFGFATTRGFPQLTEGMISQVPMVLTVSGNGRYDRFPARIVGFSSRLNTIAVPLDFLDWANRRYAPQSQSKAPSRLIVEVNNPGDPEIAKYLEHNGLEVAGDKVDSSRASYFLTILTAVIISVGAVISALALFILMLSIFLLLQKNKQKISDLLLLGYTPVQVAAGYYRLIGAVNAMVLVVGVALMLLISGIWESRLAQIGIAGSSTLAAIAWAIAIMAAITAINFLTIRRLIRRQF